MRRTITASLMALLMSGALVSLAPVASAQTGYPPALCTTANTAISAGTHNVGSTFTVRLTPVCVWDPGVAVAVTVNGQSIGTKVADASGAVGVTVTVVSATQLSVDDPIAVAAHCGANNVSGTAPSSAAQANVSATATFNVACPGAVAAPTRSGVAFTGANIARWGLIGLGLLAIGSLLVIGARRRRGAAGNA